MIKGSYFDGKTSGKKHLTLLYNNKGEISLDLFDVEPVHINDLDISSRLGNSARYISFPNGAQFESIENEAIDKMLAQFSSGKEKGLAHKLESTKYFIVLTVVSVVLFAWLFIQYGIPGLSKHIAELLPDDASHHLGQGVLEVMDKSWFESSQLSKVRQEELRTLYKKLIKNIKGSEDYKLVFRLGGKIKANAFALPNGTIVFTDELVELSENDLEIAAIMLHEIGHLQSRHSLRATIQQFSLAMFAMVITGDVSTSSSIVTAIPLMLVESGYSQEMEIEADTFSLNHMEKHQIDKNYFVTMMQKLEASYLPEYEKCKENKNRTINCIKQAVKLQQTKTNSESVTSYFSTHPSPKQRMEHFKTNL